MATSRIILECPSCHWMFEAEPPDKKHSAYSFQKPQEGRFIGDLITQNRICRNPKCKKTITIYWFAPLDFFNRL